MESVVITSSKLGSFAKEATPCDLFWTCFLEDCNVHLFYNWKMGLLWSRVHHPLFATEAVHPVETNSSLFCLQEPHSNTNRWWHRHWKYLQICPGLEHTHTHLLMHFEASSKHWGFHKTPHSVNILQASFGLTWRQYRSVWQSLLPISRLLDRIWLKADQIHLLECYWFPGMLVSKRYQVVRYRDMFLKPNPLTKDW